MDHHNMNHEEMGGMKMYFHFGFDDEFLFKQLNIDSCFKMWSVCGALFVMTLVYEAIKYVRCVHCGCRSNKMNCSGNNDSLRDNSVEAEVSLANRNCYVGRLHTNRHRLIQSILHTVQTTIGFLLMLSVMSFNLCIIFSIIVGTGVGYYIFYRPYNEIEAIHSCH